MRVLIVEDSVRMAALLERGMTGDGMSVHVEKTGAGALRVTERSEFDVIVLDVGLPDMDGFTVSRRLREKRVWTPVLMLTARGEVEDRVAGLDGGADDYLVKPF